MNKILILLPFLACFLAGCATTTPPAPSPAPSPLPTPTPTPVTLQMPSSTVTGGITLLTAAGVTAGLDFGITNTDTRTRDAGYIWTGATLTLQLAQGGAVTPAAYSQYLTTYGVQGDAQYAAIASTITSLYATYVYPKIQAGGNSAAINAYIVAFAQGLQNGAAVYAPNSVLPTSSTFFFHRELLKSVSLTPAIRFPSPALTPLQWYAQRLLLCRRASLVATIS